MTTTRQNLSEQRLEQQLAAAEVHARDLSERVHELTEHEHRLEERVRELAERERVLAEAQAIAHVGSWTWDAITDAATWSDEMYRIFGRDPRDGPLSGRQFFASVHPTDRPLLPDGQLPALGAGPDVTIDYRVVTDSGEERLLHICFRKLSEALYAGTVQDVTQLRAAEQPLSHTERAALEQLEAAFDRAPIGMGVADTAGRIVRANEALCWITGYTAEELCAMTMTSLVHPDDLEQVRRECAPLQNGEDAVSYGHRVEHAAGHIIWVQVTLTILRDDGGMPLHSLIQMVDVSEQRVYEDELHHMADHDVLTGLLNRRGFEAAFGAHLARCRRYGAGGALLMLDLDGFKAVNDTLGHAAGDLLLESTAAALTSRLRESDVMARLGGDEFAVLLQSQSRADAEAVAAALLETIRTRVTAGPDGEPGLVSASIGIALLADGELEAEQLIAQADAAMYASKTAGKARYTVSASS